MDQEKIKLLKQKLEKEKDLLEEELSTVGERNPENEEDWIPNYPDMDVLESDSGERADAYEAYGENAGILHNLEVRYQNVKNALSRIEDETYGFCSVCGEEIEEERIDANLAAETCIAHKNEEF